MRLDIAAQSDIGRRKKTNEDSFGFFRENTPDMRIAEEGALLVVADGLGGHMGGEIASKLAVSIVRDVIKEPPPLLSEEAEDNGYLALLQKHVTQANASVFQANQDNLTQGKPMGTTLIAVLVTPRKVFIGNVGDSRCYHIREGEIIGRTEDHSWVDEQVRLGLMSKVEAEMDARKNIVTRSVGTRPDVTVDTYVWHIVPGDWLLLCTDGLVNMVKDNEIVEEFRKNTAAAEIAARLVNLANENGGKDNITVLAANISPNIFRLVYMRINSFIRQQGMKLLWLIVSLLFGLGGFAAGYILRDMGIILF